MLLKLTHTDLLFLCCYSYIYRTKTCLISHCSIGLYKFKRFIVKINSKDSKFLSHFYHANIISPRDDKARRTNPPYKPSTHSNPSKVICGTHPFSRR